MTIGAFYQCYKNREATDYVLSGFRHHHPESPIVLLSDGGDDFSDLAKKYSCEYHTQANIPTVRQKALFYDRKTWPIFWASFSKHVSLLDTTHVIWLEDDVDVRRPIPLDKIPYDINGLSVSNLTFRKFHKDFLIHTRGKELIGGQGGTVFRMEFLRRLFAKPISEDFELLASLSEKCPRLKGVIPTDVSISFLSHRAGASFGEWSGYCRTLDFNYPKKVAEDSIDVLHLYKKFYASTTIRGIPNIPYKRQWL